MGHKLFVSYKYYDSNVLSLHGNALDELMSPTTVRSYVDVLEGYFDMTNHINKAESDDEDLSQYSEDTIWAKLRDRIFDSSVTIVMVSAGMRERGKSDNSQWIPWEISFSLKETVRNNRTSLSNAILAVILPDRNGNYEYFSTVYNCCGTGCTIFKTNDLFAILGNNMFNKIAKDKLPCLHGRNIYRGEASYIKPVLWADFIRNPNSYIETAISIKENANAYDIQKEV